MCSNIVSKMRFALIWSLVLLLLAPCPDTVTAAAFDPEIHLLNDRSSDIIGAAPLRLPGLAAPAGLTGAGVIVGLADSGLDKGSLNDLHPDLQSEKGKMPRVAMLKSYAGRELPDDPVGHGTHMAATIVGSGKSSNGQYKGIAPGASLYFQALLDKDGRIKLPDNLRNLFGSAYSAGVRIHVNGWGENSRQYNGYTDQIDDFVYAYPDFLPIFGAGNNGPEPASLTSEANSKNALVVGSSQVPRPVFSSEAVDATKVAESSSRGPAQGEQIKPDLLAPGSAVISACSRLTESNYTANPAYTRMGGTSMAAAVSGGAAALLSEYLQKQKGFANPSSALIKALLINGAQTPESGPQPQNGFGILDMANTVLPLEEGSVKIASNPGNLVDGQTLEYQFQVTDPERPLKATLAWIDSPSLDGAISPSLIDNLDLQVIDPAGRTLLGNDFLARGVSDQINNVEQVIIQNPQAGKYTIRVHGSDLKGPVWAAHYALVYGQIMRHKVVQETMPDNRLLFSDGKILNLASYQIQGIHNGNRSFSTAGEISLGSDVYMGHKKLYVFSRSWESGGVQILQENQGDLLVEMNYLVWQGGYFLQKGILSSFKQLLLNGKSVESLHDVPNGVQVKASLNPQLQTVYSLNAFYQEVSGVIERVDRDAETLKLINDDRQYILPDWVAVSSSDKLVRSTEQDAPFGAMSEYGIEILAPSARVVMTVAPDSRQVQHIKIERDMIVGDLAGISPHEGRIKLQDGSEYRIFSGARIFKDGKEAALENLAVGDKISGVVLRDEKSLTELRAFASTVYGRIMYFNHQLGVIYLFDSGNRFQNLKFVKGTQIFKNGMLAGTSAVNSGEWARLFVEPGTGRVIRIDMAEIKQEDEIKSLKAYNIENRTMTMSDGTKYRFSEGTQMTKNGYSITPDLAVPGEKIKITTLYTPLSDAGFLARAEVQVNPQAIEPNLAVSASVLNGALIIRGSTNADRIAVIRQDGSREIISVNSDGSFSRVLALLNGETRLKALAVNTTSGAIKGCDVEIQLLRQEAARTFLDIGALPDRSSIERLAGKGVLSGYPDGTFRPAQALNRADFLTLLGRAYSWNAKQENNVSYFKDNGEIPVWALGAVYYARKQGIIYGYQDGTFRPHQNLTRCEMIVILANTLSKSEPDTRTQPLPYSDSDLIPGWAKTSYINAYKEGWLKLFGDSQRTEPERVVTRAEATRFLDKIDLQSNDVQSGH